MCTPNTQIMYLTNLKVKLYIPSTVNTDYILWQQQLNVAVWPILALRIALFKAKIGSLLTVKILINFGSRPYNVQKIILVFLMKT